MTAIAAIRVDGMPVLIGDLLLSSEIAPAPTINLPSLGEIPSRFTVDARRYIAGLRQKICLVTPDLAAAWSGRHCDAADVLTLAKEHFEFHSVSDESLRNFFEHYARTQGNFPSSLALLRAFHDRAKGLNTLPVQAGGENHILRFQSPRFGWCELAGSGRSEIKKHLLAEYGHELALGQVNVFSRAFAEAVSIGNRLLVNELTTGLNVAMGFGGGFETCLFRKDRFAKMGGILNLYWKHQSVSGKHQFRLMSPLTFDEILVILRMDFNTFNKTGLILTR